MKKIVAAFAFALFASSAMAADAVYEAPQAPAANDTPLLSWTGFNVGVQGGYAWNNQDITIPVFPSERFPLTLMAR